MGAVNHVLDGGARLRHLANTIGAGATMRPDATVNVATCSFRINVAKVYTECDTVIGLHFCLCVGPFVCPSVTLSSQEGQDQNPDNSGIAVSSAEVSRCQRRLLSISGHQMIEVARRYLCLTCKIRHPISVLWRP